MRNEGVVVRAQGDLGVIVWAGTPTVASNRWLVESLLAGLAEPNESYVVLQVILPQAGTPDTEARRYIQDAFRTRLTGLRLLVTTPLGDSLTVSVVRTIMRGMIILSGQSQRIRLAGSIDEALGALGRESQAATPSRREVLTTLRALFDDVRTAERLPVA